MSVPFAGSLILSAYEHLHSSPSPSIPLMAPAVGHSRTLQFLFSINRRGHFLVHHGICYLFRILQGPRLPLFFAPIYFCYILLRCVFLPAHSSHSCVYLLKGAQFTITQTEFITLSDEPHWGI